MHNSTTSTSTFTDESISVGRYARIYKHQENMRYWGYNISPLMQTILTFPNIFLYILFQLQVKIHITSIQVRHLHLQIKVPLLVGMLEYTNTKKI